MPTPGSTPRPSLRIKPVEAQIAEGGADAEGHSLRRTMGLFQLTAFGIGAVVGTGIFVSLSDIVPVAGPASILSFLLAAATCVLSGLSFAELAGVIPVAGSSYAYAYATFGEAVAFLMGGWLLLEYGVSLSAVAVGWGQYLNELTGTLFGVALPDALSNPPGDGGLVNVPAALLIMLVALLLVRGVRESARATTAMVVVKLVVLALFVGLALTAFDSGNLLPFAPHGLAGIGAGASLAFFSYVGFDAISTAGEEVHNPRRNLPLAIVGSIGVCTVLYCAVTLAAIGAMPPERIGDSPAVLSTIAESVSGSATGAAVIAFGAVVAIASVVLAVFYGQTRILMSMSRDGLIPHVFERVSPTTGTPVANTWIVGGLFAVIAAVVPLKVVLDLTTIGSLAAMALVNLCVLALRRQRPDLPRNFTVPFGPVLPLLGFAFCLYLSVGFGGSTWILFLAFSVLCLLGYVAYGRRHSRLAVATDPVEGAPIP
ncbi:APC family permease [Allostreptomyces psammosilenae]|uniref:APA family basic amino acid/polyamine antiporter n=1 Tax=Allostreptomyces psammosilenae TaxID=1892865 RepID=A0A852ZPI2_9ACTN|nr:amino acid permease [Allostreptomyces psammosilenae]NYI03170.1 APA family basic amino acid/polyamine antiporter [Allostreptomyces psammosilenae]